MLKILTLLVLAGCALSSREVFDLAYQDRQIMLTLVKGPFKSILADGVFDQENHSIWDFQLDTMEVGISEMTPDGTTPVSTYSIEIVQDISVQEGVLRLYGSGRYNNKYIGVYALTNAAGAFAKFSIQDTPNDAIENAKKQPFWGFVSNPILFRIHKQYNNQSIVSLDSEEFFNDSNFELFIPETSVVDGQASYQIKRYRITKSTAANGTETYTTNTLAPYVFISTVVVPLNIEVYKMTEGSVTSYLAVEFEPIGTKMKFAIGSTYDEALQRVRNLTTYNRDLESNAKRPNKVIRSLHGKTIVLLFADPAITFLPAREYFWEKSDSLTFNADTMNLDLISTLSPIAPFEPIGVSNFSSYSLEMVDDNGDLNGAFKLTGDGKYSDKFAGLQLFVVDGDKIYADLIVRDTQAEIAAIINTMATNPKYAYQDEATAIRPYRLAINMNNVGPEWVELIDDGAGGKIFDPKNTKIFRFLNMITRTLEYRNIVDGASTTEFYKVTVAFDVNDTNGVFLLKGYTDNTFTTEVTTPTELDGKFVAIDRGSELYKTQAKFAVGDTIAQAIARRNANFLFNLHERQSVPSNHRVISAMESFGAWVAMFYPNPQDTINLGVVPNPVAANSIPVFSGLNTYKFVYNTSSTPQVVVTSIRNGVASAPDTYEIESVNDVAPTFGLFVLTRIQTGAGIPNLDGKFFAVRIGDGADGDKGYYAFGDTEEEAEREVNRIFDGGYYNYHAEATVPIAANVINTIKNSSYMQAQTSPIAPFLPTGVFIPYATRYFSFDFGSLTMTIETHSPDRAEPSVERYNILMKVDGGDYSGIFQAKGVGLPLNDLYFRIDVQDDARNTKSKLRILQNASLEDLKNAPRIADLADFTVTETTHQLASDVVIPTVGLARLVVVSPAWASVDSIDKMYDFRNTRIIENISATAGSRLRIIDVVRGAATTNEYTYNVMQDNDGTVATGAYNGVIRLVGTGPDRNKFVAFQNATPTTVPNTSVQYTVGTRFGFGVSFNNAKAALRVGDPYVIPDNPWTNANVAQAYIDFGSFINTDPGFGTPSFVWMKNGAYDPADTEVWTFDTAETNLRVAHADGAVVSYNLYMKFATPVTGTAPNLGRVETVFYLKSSTGTPTDLYNNKYVSVKAQTLIGTAGSASAESTFNAMINVDRDDAISATTPDLTMRDFRSASVPARALNLAANRVWVKLDVPIYQLNNANYEKWEFRANNSSQIKITKVSGGTTTEELYNYVSRRDISSHRGIAVLTPANATATKTLMVAIGIGGEVVVPPTVAPTYNTGTAFNANSMRVGISEITAGANLDTIEAQALARMQAFPEWNFRDIESAQLNFNTLTQAEAIAGTGTGWAKLKYDAATESYIYRAVDTERWIFTPVLGTTISNVPNSVVHDMLISVNAATPTEAGRFGAKLINATANGLKIEFQLFRGTNTTLSNKFVVLELGSGLNQKLMRVGFGDTLQDAQNEFNALGQDFNWSSFDRATAEWGVVQTAEDEGQWSLERIIGAAPNSERSTGSATTTTGGGHLIVAANGTGKPSYDPANTIDIVFNTAQENMTVKDIRPGKPNVERNYQLIRVENIGTDNLAGIYIAAGFGDYDKKFIYLEIAEPVNPANINAGKRGRLSINDTLDGVKAMNAQLRANGTFNFFQSEWIKVDSSVFIEAARRQGVNAPENSRGAYVDLGFSEAAPQPNVYDPKLTVTYTVIPLATTINGVDYLNKTIIISNVSPEKTRDDIYQFEMVNSDTSSPQHKAIALLLGNGPDGGKYIGIRFPDVSTGARNTFEAAISVGNSEATVQTALQWNTATIATSTNPTAPGYALYRFNTLANITSTSRILATLKTLGAMVSLDSDSIYLNNNTTEWSFFPDSDQATVVKRSPGIADVTTIYKTIPVKVPGETANKGVLYLKGAGGSLDKNFVGVEIDDATGTRQIKFYPFNGAANPTTGLNQAIGVFANNALQANFIEKIKVYFPNVEPIIIALINVGNTGTQGVWSSLLNTFAQGTPAQTTNITFLADREAKIQIGTGAEVNVRYKPVYDEINPAQPNTKTMIQFVGKNGATLPNGFNNMTFGLDIIQPSNPDAMRFIGLPNINLNIPADIARLQTARDTTLLDPNYIPEQLFDLSKRSIINLFDVSSLEWVQVNANDTRAGAVENTKAAWNAIYNGTDGSDLAPWMYQVDNAAGSAISVARTSQTSASIETGNSKFEYLVRMISDEGENTSVFRLYKGQAHALAADRTLYDNEISNKYQALQVGREINHFRAKIVRSSTVDGARTKLNELPFFNMMAQELWENRGTEPISNMNFNAFIAPIGQQGNNWGEWVERQDPDVNFNLDNNKFWTFTQTVGNETVTYHDIVNGVEQTTFTYGLVLMQRFSDNKGMYVLKGHGKDSDRILIFERGALNGADRNKAKFFITTAANNTYDAAIAGFNALTNFNWVEKRTLLEGVESITAASILGNVVSLDSTAYGLTPPVKVVDQRNNTNYLFTASGVDASVTVTFTVNGASTAENYTLAMVNDSATKGSAILSGVGSLNRKYLVLDVKTEQLLIKIVDTVAEANTLYGAENVATTTIPNVVANIYYKRSDLVSDYSAMLEAADTKGLLTSLDQDEIFLANDTKEFSFDQNADTVIITTRTRTAGGVDQQTISTYFLNPVLGITAAPSGNIKRGLFFLKGSRSTDALNNNFMAFEAQSSSDDGLYGRVRFSPTGVISDAQLTAREFTPNSARRVALKSFVDISVTRFEFLEQLANLNSGLGTVNIGSGNFTYNPANTVSYWLDIENRLIFIADSSIAFGTNYARIKLTNLPAATGPNAARIGTQVGWTMISNTRTDLRFNGADGATTYSIYPSQTVQRSVATPLSANTTLGGTYWGLWDWVVGVGDLNPNTTGLFWGYAGTNMTAAITFLTGQADPKIVPRSILLNNPEVLTTLYNDMGQDDTLDWHIPVNEDREALTDVNKENFAFRILRISAGGNGVVPVYNLRVGQRLVGDPVSIQNSSKYNYQLKIIQNNGINDGVILPYAGAPNTAVATSWSSTLSNKYVALRVGTIENERRTKVAVENTAAEAVSTLNALPFWNYAQRSVLVAQTTIITNLARTIANGVTTRHSWAQFAPTATDPVYNPLNTIDWVFDEANLSLSVFTVVNGETNTATYGLQIMDSESATKADFQTIGFGPFGQQYISIDRTSSTVTKIGIATTIANAVAARDGVAPAGALKYTLYEKSSIQSFGTVMNTILAHYVNNGNTLLQIYGPQGVAALNAQDYFRYDFFLNSAGDLATEITMVENNVVRTDRYVMAVEGSTTDTHNGFYRLAGTGPANGRLLAIRFNPAFSDPATQINNLMIVISGYRYYQFNQGVGANNEVTALGNSTVANTPDGILSQISTGFGQQFNVNIDNPTDPLFDHEMLQQLQNFGTLGELTDQRVFNPTNFDSLTFNRAANTMTVTQQRGLTETQLVYNVLASVLNRQSPQRNTVGVYHLLGTTPAAKANSKYHTQEIGIKILGVANDPNNYRAIVVLNGVLFNGSAPDVIKTNITIMEGRASSLPYGYWTHEKLSTVNLAEIGVRMLQNATAPRTIFNTDNDLVTGTVTTAIKSGLSFFADPRLFRATPNATSRVVVTRTGVRQYGGYFDGRDTYSLEFRTGVGDYNKIRLSQYLTNSTSTVTNTTSTLMNIKLLSIINNNKFVVQILPSLNLDGTISTALPQAELQAMFENRILAIDLGPEGENTDNIQVGYARSAGASQTQMATAIAAAVADLNARLGDLRQYSPNIVPTALAFEQQRVLASMANLDKLFVNANGIGILDVGPFGDGSSVLGPFVGLIGNNSANMFNMNMGLIPAADVNSDRTNGNNRSVFTARPIRNLGTDTLIFKLYRPTETTALVTNPFWSNLLLNQYHSVVAGKDQFILTHKWGVGPTPELAQNSAVSQPFFNSGYVLVGTTQKLADFDNTFKRVSTTGNFGAANVVWAQGNISPGRPVAEGSGGGRGSLQTLGNAFNGRSIALRNWRFNALGTGVNRRFFVTVNDYATSGITSNSDDLISSFQYRVYPKDIGGTPTGMNVTFTLSGFGPLDGAVVSAHRTGSDQKLIVLPTISANDPLPLIYGFSSNLPLYGDRFQFSRYEENLISVRSDNPNQKIYFIP